MQREKERERERERGGERGGERERGDRRVPYLEREVTSGFVSDNIGRMGFLLASTSQILLWAATDTDMIPRAHQDGDGSTLRKDVLHDLSTTLSIPLDGASHIHGSKPGTLQSKVPLLPLR
jgi:hypothetical protein